jgi:hypothetical protein
MFQCWQTGLQFGDYLAAVEGTAVVAITINGQQHLRLDLLEAVQDTAAAEIG